MVGINLLRISYRDPSHFSVPVTSQEQCGVCACMTGGVCLCHWAPSLLRALLDGHGTAASCSTANQPAACTTQFPQREASTCLSCAYSFLCLTPALLMHQLKENAGAAKQNRQLTTVANKHYRLWEKSQICPLAIQSVQAQTLQQVWSLNGFTKISKQRTESICMLLNAELLLGEAAGFPHVF